MRKTLTSLLAAGALFLAGCDKPQSKETVYPETSFNDLRAHNQQNTDSIYPVAIEGIPLSVHTDKYGSVSTHLSFVITDNERNILAYKIVNETKCTKAAALIQSEINDGDDEKIKVRGTYDPKTRELAPDSVTANGYTIDF